MYTLESFELIDENGGILPISEQTRKLCLLQKEMLLSKYKHRLRLLEFSTYLWGITVGTGSGRIRGLYTPIPSPIDCIDWGITVFDDLWEISEFIERTAQRLYYFPSTFHI